MLHLICALKHEARPVIDYFQLVHDGAARPFNIYCNMDNDMSLTVTGVGKQSAADGTVFTANYFHASKSDAWLNIGIAGHKSLPIGKAVLANKITDAEDHHTWYPRITFPTKLDALPLTTLAQPTHVYLEHDMMDTEAAGFYRSSCLFAPLDLIHCLKFISDNEDYPQTKISKQTVVALVGACLTEIEQLVTQLLICSK